MVFIAKKQNAKKAVNKKIGRPSVYDDRIKPYLPQIHEWIQEKSENQIAKILGVSISAWRKYREEHAEFKEALKRGRDDLVKTLYNTLIKKAEGFQYTEAKTIEERDPATGALIVTRKETYTRTALPDVAALNLLLKNYDRENWANDPQMLELKKQEIELQKQKIEDAAW